MRSIYNILTHLGSPVLGVLGLFSPKMKSFVKGRKGLFERLEKQMPSHGKVIWMHCASLGEYEQGLPVLEAIGKQYPEVTRVVSFFSPSGYEVKHQTALAEVVTYLPLDTQSNARRFLDIIKPDLAIFVKYEVWPNYFFELQQREIPNLLISALFRKDQAFFKPQGGLLLRALKTVDHIFVQNRSSRELLQEYGFENITQSGDTRFDRVSRQIEQDNRLDFMDAFCQGQTTLVIGSSWPEDEAVFKGFLKSDLGQSIKTVVAPHSMNPKGIERLQEDLGAQAVRYTQATPEALKKAQILILDTVGYLTKVYSYADVAYVGGAMGSTGLHNVLEPATFGVPIIIGQHFDQFPEAIKLLDLAGLYAIDSAAGFTEIITKMLEDPKFRSQTGMICEHYINSNTGATRQIMEHLEGLYGDRLI
ncbi:3-deoxy-D-manno-octulosonic acid transferase [Gilvibacter sediminis]|uniref:3-deoxy-D-manno-octulosonic acid transferase n=1 Tax=Gilvibacter sediminis TaxID=379071 RepID=UPI0023504A65|nr:glycosyltransferase N-terminal domain-containing protein [Gilvibacter sediminis]MDC7998732.1 glycosyltransferase N-terminal domain-containing protein [Gilvibacter sediminis]